MQEESARVRAKNLLQLSVVWDNHGCMPLRTEPTFLPQLNRYFESGVRVVSLNVGFGDMAWSDHISMLEFTREWIVDHSDRYRLVSCADDVLSCHADGRLGIVFDVEGMSAVLTDPGRVATLYNLGVRWMLITYNRNNGAGGGCMDVDCGLTEVGRSIIDQMEKVGMVLCLSHAGERTALEAIDYARNPAIFSHSNPYGDTPHTRNVSDRLLRACASKGGVIGLSGIAAFLGAVDDRPLIEHLMRQLRYVIDLVGAQHVGIGLDYVFDRAELADFLRQNPLAFPGGIDGAMLAPEAFTEIAEGLAKINLSDQEIRGVLGENWLRIAAAVWR